MQERKTSGMKKSVWVPGGLLLSFAGFVMWGTAAVNYGDSVAVGKYRFKNDGETSTLVLNPDHTFQQAVRFGDIEQHSEGTWRRVGEGGISFSKEFLVVSGDEPEPDGTTFSDMHKTLGLFVSIRLRQYHVLWYGKADSDNSVLGTYTGDGPGVPATLVLNSDHSFDQTVAHDGVVSHANGTWDQDSDGTIGFSKAFLKTSGEALKADEIASSMDPRGSNLQIEISKSKHTMEPVFYKRLAFR
jgi:hypothetical protein